jgi:ribonuclease Z
MSSLRTACGLAAICVTMVAGTAAAQPAPAGADEFRVTLLGTGSPAPVMDRFGPGVLVQAGGLNLLVDCGRGVTQRLTQAGVRIGGIDALFLTHLHSDHVVGIPDLWLTGWLESSYAQRRGPFRVYGPAGTRNLVAGLTTAYDWDIKTRTSDQRLDPANVEAVATEFSEGVVFDRGGVRVMAIEVDHGPLIKPAYAFRVEFGGRSVVVSGDTRFSEHLIARASGTDLLVHQVAAAREALVGVPAFKAILDHHTKPEEAGVVFSRVKPKLAVFYHFVLLGSPTVPAVTVKDVFEMTRKTYSGPLLVGEDLMAFRIDADRVVQVPPPAR